MNVELLSLRESFAPDMARHANNKKIADNVRDIFPFPYALADAEAYIAACISAGDERQCVRAIVVDGEAAGCVGIFMQEDVHSKCAELGYWLGERFWGKGVATAAVREMCGLTFGRYGAARIFATPFAHNSASCRVLEKCGFRLEGTLRHGAFKNGKLVDMRMYALLNDEWNR